jgi:hypothetical protein
MLPNPIPGPRLIGPFCVARKKKSNPVKLNVPPGPPEVMPLTPIKPSRLTPPLAVEMVGAPSSSRLWNLKTATFWRDERPVKPLASSKLEVDPNAQVANGPSWL